jgi:hypothetical protein
VPFTAANQAARNAERDRGEGGPPGTLEQIGQLFLPQFFGPEGEPPTQEQLREAHNAQFTSDNREATPGVERVNPDYPSPPGTPQQLATIQQEIENILAARARAEQAEARMATEERAAQANQGPIQESVQEMNGALSATQAHQAAVANRQQANQAQQQRQQESQGLIAGAPSRLAGLTALTIPLSAFERFSHYASVIPDPAGSKMAQMNRDSRQMLGAFAEIIVAMATQNEEQPARQQSLQDDSGSLETTNEQGATSQENFQQASEGAQGLQTANDASVVEAGQAREEVTQQRNELDEAATTKENQASTLAEQLQAWAQAHRAARQAAIEQTQERLRNEGHVITSVSED